MENKQHETDTIVGVKPATKSQGKPIEVAGEKEPVRSSAGLSWTNPAASKRLVRWLMDIANTQEEYEILVADLEGLQALYPSCSYLLKGGAAPSAGIMR